MATWKSHSLAKSTKTNYQCHARIFLKFCSEVGCTPVPVTSANLCRFAAYLGRSRSFTTVQEYLNVVRIIHIEHGYANPLQENFQIQSVLRGIKRSKGNVPHYKLAISPDDLSNMCKLLNMGVLEDVQLWCALLLCFFGLLRVSAVCVKKKSSWDTSHVLCRRDLSVTPTGCIIEQKHSKTNQFSERTHPVILPYIRDHTLCPTSALLKFLGRAGQVPPDAPLLARRCTTGLAAFTEDTMRRRLHTLLSRLGLHAAEYGTHSLRRGGATWLMSCGVPLHTIKSLGDWRSDCVQKYLKPNHLEKCSVLQTAFKKLYCTE